MSFKNQHRDVNYPINILHIMQGTFTHGGTPRELLSLVLNGNRDKFRHIFLLFANSGEISMKNIEGQAPL